MVSSTTGNISAIHNDIAHASAKAALMGRPGTPDQVASSIAWVYSPSASYTTGRMIVIDGGNSLPEERT